MNRQAVTPALTISEEVSIVVPVRNEADTLHEFLRSLLRQCVAAHEFVFVDAGSTDATSAVLYEHAMRDHSLRVVHAGPCYPGGARNVGIRSARGSWIAMTDAGTVVDAEWLGELTAAADREPHADVVFGTYEPIIRTFFETCVALAFVPPAQTVDGCAYRGPSTASMLIRKDVWAELGGFPDDLRACEDLLFFRRLAASEHRTVRAPRACVQWHVPGTLGQVFRRFRTYSLHTLRAGLGSEWHRSVMLMYLVALAVIALGIVAHWTAFLVPPAGLAARAIRSVRARRDIVARTSPAGLLTYITVAGLLVWIDFAAFVGAIDYAINKGASRCGDA